MNKFKCVLAIFLFMSTMLYSQTSSENKKTPTDVTIENSTTPPPSSQQQSEMSIVKAVIALNIVDRVPQDTGTIFPAEVKRLYCYSEILNGEGGEIQHRWYWNDELLNSVSLKISSKRFRTYSAKTILPHMKGKWRVAIVNSANETTLKWLNFTVE